MARKRKAPQLEPWEFNPTTLQGLELPDLKALYTEKRDIAQKRLKRLLKSEFKQSQAAREYKEGIPTLRGLKAASEGDEAFEKNMIVYELSKVNKWLENKYSRVGELKAVKKKSIATLHEHGYTFVNDKNYNEFVEFMSYLHTTQLDRIYSKADSDTGYSEVDQADTDAETAEKLFKEYRENGGSLPVEYFIYK